jgi:hypothetical protein
MNLQSTNSTAVQATGATGTICQRSGPYRCNSHTQLVVYIQKGDKFPTCPVNRGHSTTWSTVK